MYKKKPPNTFWGSEWNEKRLYYGEVVICKSLLTNLDPRIGACLAVPSLGAAVIAISRAHLSSWTICRREGSKLHLAIRKRMITNIVIVVLTQGSAVTSRRRCSDAAGRSSKCRAGVVPSDPLVCGLQSAACSSHKPTGSALGRDYRKSAAARLYPVITGTAALCVRC